MKNSKFKIKKKFTGYWLLVTGYSRRRRGFTLIEMLVVVSLLAIVMTVTSQLLFSTLRANKKSESLSKIKQSGDYALQAMTRMIRNAQEILENDDGQTCVASMTKLKFQNPDGGITQLVCDTDENQVASNAASLTTTEEKISLSSCSFSCSASSDRRDPDSVEIEFRLEQALEGVVEEKVAMDFKATAALRAY